ncbi:MAG: alpha/beta hydrolase [Proteobacteria bacterium]|nr:alpha/beta hydrolase [Pseudomonadota bacterium]
MKALISVLQIICLLWLSGCSSFDPATRLVIAPAERMPISSIDQILSKLFDKKVPLVLYVHGRGNEPKKTKEGKILEKLESEYGVKVLMFNWDSKGFILSRPVENANDASPYLSDVIAKIVAYRKRNPESESVPVSLLVHSMGNIVLQRAIEKDLSLTMKDGILFTNILMTGSDADAEGHNLWVQQLKANGTIIVTINKKDGTLKWSTHDNGKTPLGINPKQPLAINTYYLDVTGLVGNVHRVFQKGRQHGQISVCKILTSMLRGETPNLEKGLIDKIYNERILVPIANVDKSDNCFTGSTGEPDLDSDDES